MSLIKPFNGIRPIKKFAYKVVSPNVSYIDNFKHSKKLNFLNLLNAPTINKSKKILQSLKDKGIILQDLANYFYLYRITYNKKKLLGIVGKINLDNYENELLFVKGENSPELLEQLIRDISIVFPNLIQNLDELEFIEKRRWNYRT